MGKSTDRELTASRTIAGLVLDVELDQSWKPQTVPQSYSLFVRPESLLGLSGGFCPLEEVIVQHVQVSHNIVC